MNPKPHPDVLLHNIEVNFASFVKAMNEAAFQMTAMFRTQTINQKARRKITTSYAPVLGKSVDV